jgi:hypothetical protein
MLAGLAQNHLSTRYAIMEIGVKTRALDCHNRASRRKRRESLSILHWQQRFLGPLPPLVPFAAKSITAAEPASRKTLVGKRRPNHFPPIRSLKENSGRKKQGLAVSILLLLIYNH